MLRFSKAPLRTCRVKIVLCGLGTVLNVYLITAMSSELIDHPHRCFWSRRARIVDGLPKNINTAQRGEMD